MGFWLTLVLVSAVMMTGHRSFVSPAALPQLPQLPQLDTGGVIGQHHAPGSHAMDSAFPEDAEVQELESLKQPANEGQSVHIVKTQTSSVHNEDGNQNERHDVHEYVDENGKLVARVHQHSETSSSPGEKPHGHQTTEVEVPDMGIHKTMEQETPTEGQKEVGKAFHGAARLMQSASEAVPPPAPALPVQITENGNRRAFSNKARNSDLEQEENNNMDHYSAYSGVQYSPLDMAEYIFWTGDEKGVTLAIEEFLQEGLMNREEAIAFLQEIKNNIEYLQVHAQQRSKSIAEEQMQQNKQFRDLALKNDNNYQYDMDEQRSAWPIASSMGKFNHQNMLKAIASASYERNNDLSAAVNQPQLPISLPDFRQNLYKKSLQESNNYKLYAQNNNLYQEPTDLYERESTPTISEEDYEELLEKLRVADFLYTEYSLEEVIYQLAKVMFSQSLARGSTEAQMALQKFTTFLETEAEQGRISRALEKKILDVLIESLTDTLTEHPELVSAARVGLGSTSSLPSGNKILHQLLELGPNESEAAKPSIISAYKDEMAKVKSSKNKAHWEKTREHSVGENQSGPLLMPSVKRFKMSV